jgi:hypothetical protein
MTTLPDFFGADDDFLTGPLRDQYQRPLLIKADGEANPARDDGRWPFKRASSLSEELANNKGLHIWQQRNLVRGMGCRPDLVEMAGAIPKEDTGPRTKEVVQRNARMNAELDEIILQAFESSGAVGGRNYGTAFHALTEPGTTGYAPDRMLPDIESLARVLVDYRIKIVDTEKFVANDDLMSAGTFDHIVEVPGFGRMVADKKTARTAKPNDYAIQMAVYAGGDLYDWQTDEREPLDVNQDWALLLHTPKETGTTYPVLIDLNAGRYGARLARAAEFWRKQQVAQPLPLP